jgi:hypothetical protein
MPSRVGTATEVPASRDAMRAAILVFVFCALEPSHAMMASSLLIKLRQNSVNLLSRPSQSWPVERRRNRIDFESAALYETIFRSVYRCRRGHLLCINKRALRVPDVMICTSSRHRFYGTIGLLVLLARLGNSGSVSHLALFLHMDPRLVSRIAITMCEWLHAQRRG